ncbi:MAG: T9SS type A sorting domain-containing protein [Flavobacteriales bacterium]|nr:T9SS type A sorting domain-containing protein [Flavobacteriales bacterium]MBK9699029.1 T9SS type A sorting domain-containing protein [Flavobacteriales bacterium]
MTLTATPNGDANVPAGYQTVYVLTQGAGLTIVNAGANPSFDVTDDGSYTIHTLVYDPATLDLSIVQLGVTTGFDVNGLLVQGGGSICASLDVPGAAFSVASPNAGTLSGGASICGDGNAVTLTATPNGDANVPAGYQTVYVLTQGAGLTIVNAGANPSFDVTDDGSYTIHTLVYDPATLDLSIVQLGVTTGFDVNGLLVQGGGSICASLDVPGAAFSVASPNAGTLTAVADEVCFEEGTVTIAAAPNGDLVVPAGYQVLYVLTQGASLVIQNLSPTPDFAVSAIGTYTIHTLVYDPATLDLSIVQLGVTTGFDVNGLLVQGGGSICASLDVTGAVITTVECPLECLADAGTLSGGASICGDGNAVTLTATLNGDANVPAGYQTVYVLTQGAGLTIVNAGPNPSFDVDADGTYTIHTLVYDPATLDLSIVQLGVTTGFDVNSLLIQGGGSICASLDVPGAAFTVASPNAGTLTAVATDVCLENGVATVAATSNGDANVPAGYQTVYVLTQGAGLTIVNAGPDPSFDVDADGTYTIHTLVYDPGTLDLSIVQLGVTTGFDVNGLLVQGGGSICASLDVPGAPFNVSTCTDECLADAGTIAPQDFVVCRVGGNATLVGLPGGNAVVPAGYQTVYVLTRGFGLTIQQVSATPVFTVQQLGFYRIHTLVYDPATLDLSIVQFGVTTGFDVNSLLIQGGGSICASLDVTGAPYLVVGPFLCAILNGVFGVDQDGTRSLVLSDGRVLDEQMLKAIEQDMPLAELNLWPNPARDVLNIELTTYSEARIEMSVINILGQEAIPALAVNAGEGETRTTVDVAGLVPGQYILRLTIGDGVITQRFTKVD